MVGKREMGKGTNQFRFEANGGAQVLGHGATELQVIP